MLFYLRNNVFAAFKKHLVIFVVIGSLVTLGLMWLFIGVGRGEDMATSALELDAEVNVVVSSGDSDVVYGDISIQTEDLEVPAPSQELEIGGSSTSIPDVGTTWQNVILLEGTAVLASSIGIGSAGATVIPPLNISDGTVVGLSEEAGNNVYFEELRGRRFRMRWFDNHTGRDIWFFGEIDEEGNWTGSSVRNEFYQGSLVYLLEMIFIEDDYYDGIFKEIKPVPRSISGEGWSFGIHMFKDNEVGSGELRYYNSIKYDFEGTIGENIPLLFDGCRGEGLWQFAGNKNNQSFLISFVLDEYGRATKYIRLIYVGQFENGQFHDSTGEARQIILGNDGVSYWYYKGDFANGSRVNQEALTQIRTGVELKERLGEIADVIDAVSNRSALFWKPI